MSYLSSLLNTHTKKGTLQISTYAMLYTSPDSSDKSNNFESLVQRINAHHHKQIGDSNIRIGTRLQDFNIRLDTLQEFTYETTQVLTNHHFPTHKILWLISLKNLLDHLLKYVNYFDAHAEDNLTEVIHNKLNKLIDDYSGLQISFLTQLTVNDYLYSDLFEPFLQMILNALELLLIDRKNLAVLKPVQKILLDYFALIDKPRYKAEYHFILGQFFPVLTQFIRVVYELGESNLFGPFMKYVNPDMAIILIQKTSVNYVDLINFLRYTSFNLVVLSLENQITDSYNQQANLYFKILLNLPNLNLGLYENVSKKDESYPDFVPRQDNHEESIINLNERQEISMMFLLNHLLKLTDLRQLVEPSSYFKKELNFLLQSLTSSLSKEIHKSASQSKHSSTASFADLRMIELQKRLQNLQSEKRQKNMKSISSIIIYGSYKEKHNLVIHFFENFKNFSLKGLNKMSFPTLDTNLGKLAFIMGIDAIIRLVNLLTLKFYVGSIGLNGFPIASLSGLLETERQIQDILKVKNILYGKWLEKDGVEFVELNLVREERCVKEAVARQIEISKVIKKLQAIQL